MLEGWMTIVGISIALSSVPQIIRLLRRKKSDDVSICLPLIWIHGNLWWCYYGFKINEFSLIVTNFIGTITATILLLMMIRYRPPYHVKMIGFLSNIEIKGD